MWGVVAAPAAVLLEFQPVAGIGLVLCCDVVAALARLAGERERRSLVRSHI